VRLPGEGPKARDGPPVQLEVGILAIRPWAIRGILPWRLRTGTDSLRVLRWVLRLVRLGGRGRGAGLPAVLRVNSSRVVLAVCPVMAGAVRLLVLLREVRLKLLAVDNPLRAACRQWATPAILPCTAIPTSSTPNSSSKPPWPHSTEANLPRQWEEAFHPPLKPVPELPAPPPPPASAPETKIPTPTSDRRANDRCPRLQVKCHQGILATILEAPRYIIPALPKAWTKVLRQARILAGACIPCFTSIRADLP
jgi:hypothetical protein